MASNSPAVANFRKGFSSLPFNRCDWLMWFHFAWIYAAKQWKGWKLQLYWKYTWNIATCNDIYLILMALMAVNERTRPKRILQSLKLTHIFLFCWRMWTGPDSTAMIFLNALCVFFIGFLDARPRWRHQLKAWIFGQALRVLNRYTFSKVRSVLSIRMDIHVLFQLHVRMFQVTLSLLLIKLAAMLRKVRPTKTSWHLGKD